MNVMIRLCVLMLVVVALPARASLPEFTDLVKQVAPSVVNISTRQATPPQAQQQMPDLEQLPPFFREFFERGLPMPQPERDGRSLGSDSSLQKTGMCSPITTLLRGQTP